MLIKVLLFRVQVGSQVIDMKAVTYVDKSYIHSFSNSLKIQHLNALTDRFTEIPKVTDLVSFTAMVSRRFNSIEAEWRIYASLNWAITGSDNGLSPVRRQAIIWTNAGILLIGALGTNFNEILIEIHTFSFKKIHLKMSSAKWCPFCLGLNVLTFSLSII